MVSGECVALVTALLYFGLLEGLWGWSLGKRLLRLRVGTVTSNHPPGVRRALLRTAILLLMVNFANFLGMALIAASGLPLVTIPTKGEPQRIAQQGPNFELRPRGSPVQVSPEQQAILVAVGLVSSIGTILGVVALLAPMRTMNGFRGLHELWSGTRTYRLYWPRRSRRPPLEDWRFPKETRPSEHAPQRFGSFRMLGVARQSDREQLLLAEDPQLGRRVWIWQRQVAEPALGETQRTINRSTRARWVACGSDDLHRWDAFLAIDGATLPQVVACGGPLAWAQTRPILEDLVEELTAACADGTLPACLTTDQVWAQPYGRVQLLGNDVGGSAGDDSQHRILRFLREVAVLALEGKPRSPEAQPDSIRALVPIHAESMLHRLLGVRQPYQAIAELQKDLKATRDRPTRVTALRRLGHLAITALLLSTPFVMIFAIGFPGSGRSADAAAYGLIWFCVGLASLWALLFRGGFAFYRGGITLRRADGRKPSRLQCGFRAFLVWAPIAVLLSLTRLVAAADPEDAVPAYGLWFAALFLLLVYAVLAIRFPTRSLHDRLAGTYLVPE
jgi:hypothetical protein